MKTARRFLLLAVMFALTCGLATAGGIKVQVGGPLVLGDQVFSGSRLEIEPRRDGRVLAILLDGRQIALASADGGAMIKMQKVIVRVDEHGYWHLTGLRATATSSVTPLAFETVARGIATLRTGPRPDEGIAAAR